MTPIYRAFVGSPIPNAICQWVTNPQVNPNSYHLTLGLSDKYDHVFYFGQHNFSAYTAGFLHPYRSFGSCRGSLTPMFQAFHLRGLTTPFLLLPSHINYLSSYDLELWVFIGRGPKDKLNPHSPRVVNHHTVYPHLTRRDVTVHMNVMMPIHISNSNGSYTIIFHVIQQSC